MTEKEFKRKIEKLKKQGRIVDGYGIKIKPKKNYTYILYIIIFTISIIVTIFKHNNITKKDITNTIIQIIANYS